MYLGVECTEGHLLVFHNVPFLFSALCLPSDHSWFPTWLTPGPCRWRLNVPPKRRTFSELHSFTLQKSALSIVTAVITS
jgi:hypothetical protein